jgi:hypothetical protein
MLVRNINMKCKVRMKYESAVVPDVLPSFNRIQSYICVKGHDNRNGLRVAFYLRDVEFPCRHGRYIASLYLQFSRPPRVRLQASKCI